ncbi:MAG: hypothetical protein AAGI90_03880 [Chlamydiota bacterium]
MESSVIRHQPAYRESFDEVMSRRALSDDRDAQRIKDQQDMEEGMERCCMAVLLCGYVITLPVRLCEKVTSYISKVICTITLCASICIFHVASALCVCRPDLICGRITKRFECNCLDCFSFMFCGKRPKAKRTREPSIDLERNKLSSNGQKERPKKENGPLLLQTSNRC